MIISSGPLSVNGLTHSCLKIIMTSVLWTHCTFEDKIKIKHKFTKYLMESCEPDPDEYFSGLEMFPSNALIEKNMEIVRPSLGPIQALKLFWKVT